MSLEDETQDPDVRIETCTKRRAVIRRASAGSLSLALATCLVLGSACQDGEPRETHDRPPNIVLILADDLGWSDLSIQGSGYYETPQLDRLARSGMRFSDAYANAPNCAPSRASLLSGQYPPRHGIYTNGDPWRGARTSRRLIPADSRTTLPLEVFTLAEALGEAGYATAHLGKWHLGEVGQAGPAQQGFDVNIGGTHAGAPKSYFSPYENSMLEDGPQGEYLTDRLTDEAIRFMQVHRDQPFFVYLSHFAVHTPIRAPEETRARYEGKPAWHEQDNATYAAMVEHIDRGVGRILEQIEALDLTDETLVIFFSDNGGLGGYASSGLPGSRHMTDNHPLKGGKGQLYEGGLRVPLFVVWPGHVAPQSTSDVPVMGTDLYPTILEIAGISPRPGQLLDGESLAALLRGEGAPQRKALYWYFPAYLDAFREPGLRTAPAAAIREGEHKLIWFLEDDALSLYDLKSDPGERNDLSDTLPELTHRLHEDLKRWLSSTHAPMLRANPRYQALETS